MPWMAYSILHHFSHQLNTSVEKSFKTSLVFESVSRKHKLILPNGRPSECKALRSNTDQGGRQQQEAAAGLQPSLAVQKLMHIQPRAGHATSSASTSIS